MKISVAMASYNGADFIIEQLESVINQTKKVDEIIICDDGSKDKTFEIVTNYIKEKKLENLIKLVKNEENLGYASNFLKAVSLTTGDYIFFCDQDDLWVEDKVENMTSLMEANTNIDLLCSEFDSFVSSAARRHTQPPRRWSAYRWLRHRRSRPSEQGRPLFSSTRRWCPRSWSDPAWASKVQLPYSSS